MNMNEIYTDSRPPDSPQVLSIDLETYSSADLSKCGVYRYVEADDFEILLLAFALSGIWAVALLFRKKGNVQQEFPFVPFLLAGAVLEMIFA